MNRPNTSIAIAIIVVLTAAPDPAHAQAGGCSEINRLQAATERFGADLEADVDAFTNDELGTASLNAMKTITEGRPAPAAGVELVERYRAFRDYVTETASRAAQLRDLSLCLRLQTPGCLAEWAGRQGAAVKSWLTSLVTGDTKDAIERVDKASAIYSNYVNESLSMFQTGATNALGQCVDTYTRQAAAAEPVSAEPPPTAPGGNTPAAQPGQSGGGGGGKGVWAIIATTAGVTLGALALAPSETPTTDGVPVSTAQPTPAAPTGVTRFDGTYDFILRVPQPGGSVGSQNLTGYVRVSNGAIASTDGRLSGTVNASGTVTMTGLCPFGARDPATYRGTLGATSGTGQYGCVDTPQYDWTLSRR